VVAGAALLAFCANLAFAQSFTAAAPEDLIFYQVFIDRFDNGSTANDRANPRATFGATVGNRFHGGDIAGIKRRLGYIQGIGANAIWITPHVENVNNYHGYAAYNFYNVEPNFGSMDEMREMIVDANKRGIGVYFDLVGGHMGNIINSGSAGYPAYLAPPSTYTLRWSSALRYPAPFNSLDYFHAHGQIGSFSGIEQEVGELSGLDDLKTETPYIREEMTKVWEHWMQETGVSGFRVDTVKHVDRGFWEYLMPRLRAKATATGRQNFYVFGELYGADDNYMRQYLGTIQGAPYLYDGILDFQYYYRARDVFARADSAPSNWSGRITSRASSLGVHHLKTPNFFDNHDVPRFLNDAAAVPGAGLAERLRRLDLALVALYTAPGPPVLYYGTEQDFDGGTDPTNREDMFDGGYEQGPSLGDNFDETAPRYQLVRRLSALRSALRPLRRGNFTVRAAATGGPGVLAYSRVDSSPGANPPEVTVTLNTSTSTVSLAAIASTWPAGTVLVNALDPAESIVVGTGGTLPARVLPAQYAALWVTAAGLPDFDTTVTDMTPVDGALEQPLRPTIRVAFSKPMNRASVEAAVSLSPEVAIQFSWNAESTELTILPLADLAPRTFYTVAVASGARNATNGAMPYGARADWRTTRAETILPIGAGPWELTARAQPAIVIDGVGADWPDTAAAAQAENSGFVGASRVFVWKDAEGDDRGPGTYTYPTNTAFSGADADIAEVRLALTPTELLVYFRPVSVNPASTFLTTYWLITFDTASGGDVTSLGHNQTTNALGVGTVPPHPELAPELEVAFTGPVGATARAGGVVLGTSGIRSAFQLSTGVVELAIPRSLLGASGPLDPLDVRVTVAAGLETFGSLREVAVMAAGFVPGGGIAQTTDPNFFDLAGATLANQQADLGDFDAWSPSLVSHSYLMLRLVDPSGPSALRVY